MMKTITIRALGITVERAVFKAVRGWVPGAVEATLAANYGLPLLPPHLPAGATFTIPDLTEAQKAATRAPLIRLVD